MQILREILVRTYLHLYEYIEGKYPRYTAKQRCRNISIILLFVWREGGREGVEGSCTPMHIVRLSRGMCHKLVKAVAST